MGIEPDNPKFFSTYPPVWTKISWWYLQGDAKFGLPSHLLSQEVCLLYESIGSHYVLFELTQATPEHFIPDDKTQTGMINNYLNYNSSS